MNLRRLREEEFDIVVIGGGITGAGIARDAAMRGMRVALIEKGGFAGGTSSKSSKMIHGGLRYLSEPCNGLSKAISNKPSKAIPIRMRKAI